jgi:hypothetical protein
MSATLLVLILHSEEARESDGSVIRCCGCSPLFIPRLTDEWRPTSFLCVLHHYFYTNSVRHFQTRSTKRLSRPNSINLCMRAILLASLDSSFSNSLMCAFRLVFFVLRKCRRRGYVNTYFVFAGSRRRRPIRRPTARLGYPYIPSNVRSSRTHQSMALSTRISRSDQVLLWVWPM